MRQAWRLLKETKVALEAVQAENLIKDQQLEIMQQQKAMIEQQVT